MSHRIQFGSKTIDFHIEYAERKTLGISVMPDLSVFVKAPHGTSVRTVLEKVRKRAPWIIKQQSFFLSFEPRTPPRRYLSGETHLYLGRQYLLSIEAAKLESVRLNGRFITVYTEDKSRAAKLVRNWYLKKAQAKLPSIAEPLIARFKRHGVQPTEIVLREMAFRWGSCTPNGRILLNPELIKAPRGCIEYVITHELCHLVHHDHTQKFFNLQSGEFPRWEKWKSKLENLLA